jgi:alkylhydroperoxidase family enzyme
MEDWRGADLSPTDRAICRHAERVALTPAATTAEDIDRLRAAGLTDRAILDVNLVASLFAFFVRMADGLGVELEAIMEDPPSRYR